MGLVPPAPFPPERVDISASSSEVSVVDNLGDLPLFVLTAADPLPAAPISQHDIWLGLQEELAALSTDSKHETVTGAHHLSIQRSSIEISAAIQDLIERIKAHPSP